MDVSDIMDEKSQCLGFSVVFIWDIFNHCLVDEGVFVITCFSDPVDNVRDGFTNVVLIEFELWEVFN